MVKLMAVLLQSVYMLLRIQKVQNRIVFITRQSNHATEDLRILVEAITKENEVVECVVLSKMIPASIVGKIAYSIHMIKQLHYMASSKVVVLDTYCIVASLLKHRKGLVIVQIWHALGAMKKFGYSALESEEGSTREVAELMKMHQQYDYVVTSSEYCRAIYAEAFNVDIEKVVVFPLPRLDKLAKDKLGERKIVLYAPTFRKKQPDITDVVKCLTEELPKNYELWVKPHPLSIMEANLDNVVDVSGRDFMQVINDVDIIITDYSSLIFEGAYAGKEIYLYAYDYERYNTNRGFYLDYEKDIPFSFYTDARRLMHAMERSDRNIAKEKEFADKYIAPYNDTYAGDLSRFIVRRMEKTNENNTNNNGSRNRIKIWNRYQTTSKDEQQR